MRKVYTITFHKADNYGALLQAYALQTVISKKYTTEILNYDNKSISKDYKYFKKQKGIKKQLYQFTKDIYNLKKEFFRKRSFNNFRKILNFSETFSLKDVHKANFEDSIFITGSDQVWNTGLTGGVDNVYTLDFVSSNRTISYAASAGDVKNIESNSSLLDRIKKIKYLSVREKTLKDYIECNLNISIKLTLDPTLLLQKDDWNEIAGKKRLIDEKYVFVYCGAEPEFFYDIVNDIAEKKELLIVYSGRRDKEHKFKGRKKSFYEFGPSEFVNLIKYSECVVTPSFHGTALSVILNKELYAVLNRSSDRLVTLLRQLKLDNCIISDMEDYGLHRSPKWDEANRILSEKREDSIKWLYNAIEKCDE